VREEDASGDGEAGVVVLDNAFETESDTFTSSNMFSPRQQMEVEVDHQSHSSVRHVRNVNQGFRLLLLDILVSMENFSGLINDTLDDMGFKTAIEFGGPRDLPSFATSEIGDGGVGEGGVGDEHQSCVQLSNLCDSDSEMFDESRNVRCYDELVLVENSISYDEERPEQIFHCVLCSESHCHSCQAQSCQEPGHVDSPHIKDGKDAERGNNGFDDLGEDFFDFVAKVMFGGGSEHPEVRERHNKLKSHPKKWQCSPHFGEFCRK